MSGQHHSHHSSSHSLTSTHGGKAHVHSHPPRSATPGDPQAAARFAAGQRCTWISVLVNLLLSVVQVVVGLLANAQSLVADGLHSASDLVADFLVLYANRQSRHPADDKHPYGHGRVETVTSLALGGILGMTGLALLYGAGSRLTHLAEVPPVAPVALWTALATLVAKELLFRYMLAVGEKVRSPMLIANAWHARSDAASSLVVAAGIGGSLLGFVYADLLAAAIVGFMIVRMGWVFAYEALRELIDTALSEEETEQIRAALLATPGVIGVHDLRTRRMAHQAQVDAHVLVASRVSVSEGHRVAEAARVSVLQQVPQVMEVLVHVDCEDEGAGRTEPLGLPERAEVERQVADWLGKLPLPTRMVLHYLNGQVEVDLLYVTPPAVSLSILQAAVQAGAAGDARYRKVRLWSGEVGNGAKTD